MIFYSLNLLLPILALGSLYAIYNLNLYGAAYAFNSQGLGYSLNNIFGGTLELIAFGILYFFVDKTPRRYGVVATYGLCISIGALFFFKTFTEDLMFLSTVFLSVIRLLVTYGFILVSCMTLEYFPVKIQSTTYGLVQILSLSGVFLGPNIISIANDHEINPIGLLSAISVLLFWPIFLL